MYLNSNLNCDGYKYLLIQAASDSKIINVDLLKLIGNIDLGFIRYVSNDYIMSCNLNIKPSYVTLYNTYKIGFSDQVVYKIYGIK